MLKRPGVLHGGIGTIPYLREMVLNQYPEAKFNEVLGRRFNEDEIIAFLQDCDCAITGGDIISDRVLTALPHIRNFGFFGVGLNTVDLHACLRHGVKLGYRAGANKVSVAELALSYMIAGLRFVSPLSLAMRQGKRPTIKVGRNLSGRKVGLHGCGHIGKEVVRLLKPFGCEIFVHDIRDYPDFYRANGIKPVGFDELLGVSEVLSLHIPHTKKTHHLYDEKALAKLRPDCVLVNTCRGGVVNEDALLKRLESGDLVAACFDVFEIEPATNERLLSHPNLLSTPHIGASTHESRIAMAETALSGLKNGLTADAPEFADYL
jgi:phosphoglycerate dehydrogenase-like enzyme